MNPVFGAIPAQGGYCFRVWAPAAHAVALHLRRDGAVASYQLPAPGCQLEAGSRKPEAGIWELVVEAEAGDCYAYTLDGGDALPDPASRFQPDGVHGWSELVDPRAFAWTDGSWPGLDPRRAVIYELHVGAFTPEGTFRGAIDKLPYLRDLGVTAIELMPLADFAGRRNWGYDGVALFAPSRAYGRPADLRAFVDAAHHAGLAVLVDVVYNHLGPEGAYMPAFAPQFLTAAHQTPWGGAVNLDGPGSDVVRRLLIDNAIHWLREYHADGLRVDATHSLIDSSPRHFLAELADAARAASGGRAVIYAEDYRNLSTLVLDADAGGWGLDGIWADDFHHVVRRMIAGDTYGYYEDYEGSAGELAAVLRDGWLFTGQHSKHLGEKRGTDPSRVALRKSVVCLQNHDQVGNRALGDRLHQQVDEASWRAAVTVLLTCAMTPILFMGQEWAAATPFQFFTDFHEGLGRMVKDGRRREFAAFPEFAGDNAGRVPDPQSERTFLDSRLRGDEKDGGAHARSLALHRALLALRGSEPSLVNADGCSSEAFAPDEHTVVLLRGTEFLVAARLRGAGTVRVDALASGDWRRILDTEQEEFASDPQPPRVETPTIGFRRPGAIVFRQAA